MIALVAGIALVVGAAAGSRDPLQPLAGLVGGAAPKETPTPWKRIRSVAELDEALKSAGKPAMLDFYADWCVSCKEMEKFTFSDASVRAELDQMLLLQADVTAASEADRKLLQRFSLFGPPGIIFFDAAGREIAGLRVVGYQPPARFLKTLAAARH
jgi:thiol:disulfide interchange protein DsbD